MSINGRLVSNPGCKLEKEARDGFLASMRLLNVDDAPKAIGRPPRPVGVSYENLARIGSGGRGWPRDV